MKIVVTENKYGLSVQIQPETIEESNMLLRFTNNARSEKPSITFYLSGEKQELNLWLRKVNERNQSNAIRPKGQRK